MPRTPNKLAVKVAIPVVHERITELLVAENASNSQPIDSTIRRSQQERRSELLDKNQYLNESI